MIRPRGTQLLVVLALLNLVSYAARNALFTVYPDLIARYDIDHAQLGLLTTVFMIPHAAATLPFGWAGDHFDRRRVIAFGIVLASLAGGLGALSTSYEGLATSRALVGFGTAAVVPVANSILGQLYEGPRKASRLAVFNLGLFLGGVVGLGTGIALGFPYVVIALAVPGLGLAAVLAVSHTPAQAAPSSPGVVATGWGHVARIAGSFVQDARVLLEIRTLRWVILSATTMAFAAGGYNAWLKEFLVEYKGLTEGEAMTLLSLSLVGGLGGILVGGRIADRLRARRAAGRLWTMVLGMSMTVPCAAIAIELPNSWALYVAGIATLFFISWYHAPMAATVDDLAPAGLSVGAQGLVIFTMHMLGTAPSSWVVGVAADAWSLHDAMWIPTALLGVAAASMAYATRSFASDQASARRERAARAGGAAGEPTARSL